MDHPTLKDQGIGLVIVSLEGVIAEHAMCFEFPAMNNEIEYEALTTRLWVAKELVVQDLKAYSDLQLVVEHIKGNYNARKKNMIKHVQKVKDLIFTFHRFEIQQILKDNNS